MPPPPGTWNPIEGPGDYTMTKQVHNDSYPAIDPVQANLSGRSVFISGASKGLGQQIALSYAQAGASQIAIAARSSLSETAQGIRDAATRAGKPAPEVLAVTLDVTDAQSVSDAAKEVKQRFGRLDILVNNAGILGGRGLVKDSDPDEWWNNMTVNLRGPYLLIRAFLPMLLSSSSHNNADADSLRTIVTISSVGAHCVSPTLSSYQISKLAVMRLTEFVAAEYGPSSSPPSTSPDDHAGDDEKANNEHDDLTSIIAFSVHPGNVLTDIINRGEGMDPPLKAVFTESPRLCGDSLVYLTATRRPWLSGRYVNVTWDLPELVSAAKRAEIAREGKLKVRLVV